MFIFLSKFLPLFIYPLGAAALLLFLTWIFWKQRRFAKFLVILTFLVIFLGGNRYAAFSLARTLEWRTIPQGELPLADVIIVLGGGTEPRDAPRQTVELNAAGDRLFYGAALYHQYKAPRVLLSGGEIEFMSSGGQLPAKDATEIMNMLGVPSNVITALGDSQNTYEEAVLNCAWMKENGMETALLVTSATHMPRALKIYEKQGCNVTPAPADFAVTQKAWQKLWHPNIQELLINLVPSYSNLSLLTKSLKEYIGMCIYWFRGWL